MSTVKDNIDQDLNDILDKAKDKNVSKILNESNSTKSCSINVKQCNTSILFPTVQSAYKAMMKGRKVYLLRREENGKIKERPFAQCSRKCFGNSNFCKKHMNNKSVNFKWSELIVHKMATLATPKSSYFMKKGSKIFNKSNNNLPDEINKVMENANLREKLIKYAKDLITNSTSKKPTLSITLDKLSEDNINENIIDDKNTEEDNNVKELEESDEESNEESDEENEDEESVDDSSEDIEVIEDDEDSELEEDDSSEEEVSCKQIYTNDGRLLYLDPNTNTVYDPEGDNTGKEFAKLIEVNYEKASIK